MNKTDLQHDLPLAPTFLVQVHGTPDAVQEQQLQQPDTVSDDLLLVVLPPPQHPFDTVTAAVVSQGVDTKLPAASVTEGQLHGTPAAAQFTHPQL